MGPAGVSLTFLTASSPEEHVTLAEIQASQPPTPEGEVQPKPLPFNKAEIEAFRYR